MRVRTLPLVVLAAAVAALVVSAGWAVSRDGDGWTMGRYGPGMMGYAARDGGEPVRDLAAARRQAQRFADRLDLRTGEVMRFSNHYYAELREADGRPATEVLVDPTTGAVWLEYGPAMMWNTRYGMMSDFRLHGTDERGGGMMGGGMMGGGMMGGGMMGGGMAGPGAAGSGEPGTPFQTRSRDVSAAEAREIARRWLDRNGGGLSAGEPDRFPGYFTLHALRAGKVAGMLSVNAATGAVWPHWWHGRFLAMTA